MPCADVITSYMCDAVKNISHALCSSLVFELCTRNLNLNIGGLRCPGGVCDFLVNSKHRSLRFPGACDLLLHRSGYDLRCHRRMLFKLAASLCCLCYAWLLFISLLTWAQRMRRGRLRRINITVISVQVGVVS